MSKIGGKNIGLYRSIAWAMISQVWRFEYTRRSFGWMYNKSGEISICCGCGHTAFGADRFPLKLIFVFRFSNHLTYLQWIFYFNIGDFALNIKNIDY
jgi:hypothetical protein